MSAQVLVNCKWETHKHITGVQRYSYELIEALSASGLAFDRAAPRPGPPWKQMLWEQRTLPRLARTYDALLCPANVAPVRLPERTQLILTVHCLRFLVHPESYSARFVAWYRFMLPRAIARAQTVLAVSETTAEEIQRAFPVARGKVRVVYPGVSRGFGADGISGDASIPLGAYWVFVGNTSPAKNLGVLLRALKASRHPHRVVLLGVSGTQLERLMKIERCGLESSRVIPLGHINETDRVAAIVRGAAGLLAPSLYESFDLPTVEAMACGRPVIASDTAIHREICKEVPRYVPAGDPGAWASAMDRLSEDSEEVERLSRAGIERAAHFDWGDTGALVSQILSRAGCEAP